MLKIVVTNASAADAKRIALLEKECFARPWSEKSIIEAMNNGALFLAARDGLTLCAYLGVYLLPPEGQIANIAVSEPYRRMGLGMSLLQCMKDACEPLGVKDFTLEVRPSNIPALRLYERFGFKEEGRRRGYYDDNGEDAIIMWYREQNNV